MDNEKLIEVGLQKRKGEIDLSWQQIADEYTLGTKSGEQVRDLVRRHLRKAIAKEPQETCSPEIENIKVEPKLVQPEQKSEFTITYKDNSMPDVSNEVYEIRKERYKLQDERMALTRVLREQSRYEYFIEKALEAINNRESIIIPELIIDQRRDKNRDGLLLFADAHYGKEFEVKDLKGKLLNKYSPEIFERRMWKLLKEAVEISKKEGFTSISIMSLGDELEGMLRLGALMNLRYGIVESAIKYSYFIANWLNELSKHVRIDFYSTCGNHTSLRLIDNNKDSLPQENMSKIIDVLISEILKDNKNIIVHKNELDKIFVNIQGFNILGVHGEEKDVTQSIKDYSHIYNENIDFLATGHKHHANSINLGFSKGTIGVGSVIGVDDYSIKLKRIADPSATFVVFEKCKGKSIEYNIILN